MVVRPKENVITVTQLTILAFATAFFPRTLDFVGAPSAINFLHFVAVPIACIFSLVNCRTRNKNQLETIKLLIVGLFILFTIILISALVNQAGAINAAISFMLLGEPYLLIITIVALSLSPEKLAYFKKWLYRFFFSHIVFVFVQKYVLKVDTWEHLGMVGPDRIQGVFLISGAGHVVGSSVSLTFALYYFFNAKKCPLWLKIIILMAAVWNIILADGKQVLLSFMVAMILLFLIKLNDFVAAIKYIFGGAVIGTIFWWCIENLSAFSGFKTWIRPEIYGPNGEATLLKTAAFRIIPTYYESILNWLFGLGPGHTIGRLGGWMLRDYVDLLSPLGSTVHIATKAVWRAVGQSWLGDQSSMFSPLFGWAGIWGDLGILGLAAYLYLAYIVWRYACKDDLSRFFLLTILVFGCIFSQMEEPGYMLSVACIIGIQYKEYSIGKNQIKNDID